MSQFRKSQAQILDHKIPSSISKKWVLCDDVPFKLCPTRMDHCQLQFKINFESFLWESFTHYFWRFHASTSQKGKHCFIVLQKALFSGIHVCIFSGMKGIKSLMFAKSRMTKSAWKCKKWINFPFCLNPSQLFFHLCWLSITENHHLHWNLPHSSITH